MRIAAGTQGCCLRAKAALTVKKGMFTTAKPTAANRYGLRVYAGLQTHVRCKRGTSSVAGCSALIAGVPHHAGSRSKQVSQKNPKKADICTNQDIFKGSIEVVIVLSDMTPWPCACARNEHNVQRCHHGHLQGSQSPRSLQDVVNQTSYIT